MRMPLQTGATATTNQASRSATVHSTGMVKSGRARRRGAHLIKDEHRRFYPLPLRAVHPCRASHAAQEGQREDGPHPVLPQIRVNPPHKIRGAIVPGRVHFQGGLLELALLVLGADEYEANRAERGFDGVQGECLASALAHDEVGEDDRVAHHPIAPMLVRLAPRPQHATPLERGQLEDYLVAWRFA